MQVELYSWKYFCHALHGRRKVWKSEDATSNVAGIIAPPSPIEMGLIDLPKFGDASYRPASYWFAWEAPKFFLIIWMAKVIIVFDYY